MRVEECEEEREVNEGDKGSERVRGTVSDKENWKTKGNFSEISKIKRVMQHV